MPPVPSSLEKRRLRAYIAMLLIDTALLHAAFILAAWLYEGSTGIDRAMITAQGLLPIYFTICLYNSSYSARSLVDWIYGVRQLAIALAISAALINFVAFYLKTNAEFSRVVTALGLILSFIFLAASRRTIVAFIKKVWGAKIRNRLVIEDGGSSFFMEGAQVVSAREYNLEPGSHDPHMLDRLGQLFRNQDRVVVSCPQERREAWAFLMKAAGVYGEIVSEPAHNLGAIGVHRYEDQDRTTLVVAAGPLGLRARAAKRLFDIAASGLGLLALSPVFLAVALAIKLEDGGQIFFVQKRMGRGNQFFEMLKFRSMREEKLDGNGDRSTSREDDRVTRIGKFIRSTSIDELPQLLNVLRGEMSMVGPRPHAIGSRANSKLFWEVDGQYWKRHSLKPGLTGLAQIRGHRGATEEEKDLTDRLQSDLEYINTWSLQGDLGIIFKTLWVLRHENAY